MTVDPTISVVVPAYNAEHHLPECLRAINDSTATPAEIIVVDDGSKDQTMEIARRHGATILETGRAQSGPANARNLGAAAALGDIVLFVDADVVVRPDTVRRVQTNFFEHPGLAAVFGSYDSEPAEQNFLSQYKNLQHHFVHQSGNADAETFWSGCGAIRRQLFLEAGGFDAARFQAPSVEDIELGYRLKARACHIRLDRDIQVCHRKRWTFWQLLHTEIFRRAIPWSELIFARQQLPQDLNVGWGQRVSALMAWIAALTLPFLLFSPAAAVAFALALAVLLYANRGFYAFLRQKRGYVFVLQTIPMHTLYFLYSSLAFAWCWLCHRLGRRPAPATPE